MTLCKNFAPAARSFLPLFTRQQSRNQLNWVRRYRGTMKRTGLKFQPHWHGHDQTDALGEKTKKRKQLSEPCSMNMENIFVCVAPLPAPHRPQLRAAHLVGRPGSVSSTTPTAPDVVLCMFRIPHPDRRDRRDSLLVSSVFESRPEFLWVSSNKKVFV